MSLQQLRAPRQGTQNITLEVRRVGTMSTVHRLKLAGAVFALAGAVVCTQVWGDASGGRNPMQPPKGRTDAPEVRLGDRLVTDKFAESPIIAYRTSQGETLIAAQLKPALEVPPARPRDLAI